MRWWGLWIGSFAQKVQGFSTEEGGYVHRFSTGKSDGKMAGSGALTDVVDRGIVGRPVGDGISFRLGVQATGSGAMAQAPLDGLGRLPLLMHGCKGSGV